MVAAHSIQHSLRGLAAELALAGKHREAAHVYEQLLAAHLSNGEVALRLGTERQRFGDRDGAIAAYECAAAAFESEGRPSQAQAVARVIDALRRAPRVVRPPRLVRFIRWLLGTASAI